MAYSLRLPDALDAAARAKADYLGISLNALLCVALDAYLRGPAALPTPHAEAPLGELCKAEPAADRPAPKPEPEQPSKLSRAEKQALYEQRKAEFKRINGQR